MWDAWAEQMSWARSIVELEQSCGVSRNAIQDFYNTQLYPRRKDLLQSLSAQVATGKKDAGNDVGSNPEATLLRETPLAPILLSHVATAANVMSAR